MQQNQQAPQEKHSFSIDDVISLANAAPGELDKQSLQSLAILLQISLKTGSLVQACVDKLNAEIAKPKDEAALDQRQAAKLLLGAGRAVEAGEFLPTIEEAKEDNDFEALNMLSRHYSALHAEQKTVEHLEQAWHVTQAVLAPSDTDADQRQEALRRAVELAPKIREALGQVWLEESFTGNPKRGREILSSIGSAAATALQFHPHDTPFRLQGLKLQATAVDALMKADSPRAGRWRDTLNLLALNWLREAGITYRHDQSTSRGPSLRRDPFGNYFYGDEQVRRRNIQRGGKVQPIKTADLLEIVPSDAWLELVDTSLRPKFDKLFAQLYLKVNEEDKAFPFIEKLAAV